MKPVVVVILAASVAGCLTSADYAVENGKTAPNRTEGNGTLTAGKTGLTISQNDINMLLVLVRRQITSCWNPPVGTGVPPVSVRFALNQDGSLAGDPAVLPVNSRDLQNAKFQPAAQSAVRAVRTCMPLRLPSAWYDFWKEMEIRFDPREM
jgi:colicin import membrane protein